MYIHRTLDNLKLIGDKPIITIKIAVMMGIIDSKNKCEKR